MKLSLKIIFTIAKFLPRGKGAFPRLMSNLIVDNDDNFMRLSSGAILHINKSTLDEYSYIYSNGGVVDRMILSILKVILSEKDTFYDIGANVGSIGIDIANIFKDNINVVMFEPQTMLEKSIKKSIDLNQFKNVKSYDFMLGDKDGLEYLYVNKESTKSSIKARTCKDKMVRKEIYRIDALMDNVLYGSPPDVIKMDVEGAELSVISGALEMMRKCMPSLIFESDNNAERFGYGTQDIISLLIDIGYDSLYGWKYGLNGIVKLKDGGVSFNCELISKMGLDNFIVFNSNKNNLHHKLKDFIVD